MTKILESIDRPMSGTGSKRSCMAETAQSLFGTLIKTNDYSSPRLHRARVGQRAIVSLTDCGKTLWVPRNVTGLNIWENRSTPHRMLKKAVQQGRSERRGEVYASVR